MSASSTAISIVELSKVFGSGAGRAVAVDRISLEIEPGELFFLLGPSGCGKTTLLRMIAGFTEPTAGRLAFNGRDVTHTPPNRRHTGMVFQSYALWPHMTVAQNVAFGLAVRRVPTAERERRVREALAAVRMEAYASRRPNQLSGGQQQRIALARALVIRPDVLLLDEPLSNLDARLRIELRSEIRRICKESGITTVYVTHDQKEALSMADRVAVIDRGRLVQVGPPRELYRRPASRFVAEFLGETNFIPGRVVERGPDAWTVQTRVGTLRATPPLAGRGEPRAGGASAAGEVLLSIRPEALRPATDGEPNALRGTLVESVYLGEIAQHLVQLDAATRIRAAQLNPDEAPAAPGQPVVLAASPGDVVVVPA